MQWQVSDRKNLKMFLKKFYAVLEIVTEAIKILRRLHERNRKCFYFLDIYVKPTNYDVLSNAHRAELVCEISNLSAPIKTNLLSMMKEININGSLSERNILTPKRFSGISSRQGRLQC